MRRIFTRGFALLALLSFVAVGHSAPSLAPSPALLGGRLLDATTGEPIVGAHLSLHGQDGRTVVSDTQGMFLVPNLQQGEVTLIVTHVAYISQERILRIQEGQPLRMTLLLEPIVRSVGDPVEVRAPRPASVQRIDAHTIDQSNWQDVGDAVRTLPGVLVYEEGGRGGRKTISLRGSKPSHVRVRVDGIMLNDGEGEAVDLGQIPLEGVESIEVLPATQPGAPGGVVEITTRHTGGSPFSRLALEGSQPDALSASAAAGIAAVGLFLQGTRSDGDFRYEDEEGTLRRRINNQREHLTGLLRVERPLGAGNRVTGTLTGSYGQQGSPGPLYQSPTPEANQEEQQLRGELSFERNWGSSFSTASLFVSQRNRSYASPAEQLLPGSIEPVNHVPADLEETSERAGLVLSHESTPLPVEGAGLSWSSEIGGTQERYESVNHLSNGVAVSQTEGEVKRISAHGSLSGTIQQLAWGWKWRTGATIRHELLQDHHPGDNSTPFEGWTTARLHAQAGPSEGRWSLHGSLGDAVLPAPFTSRFLVESVYSLGNPSLKPERVEEASGGLALRTGIGSTDLAVTVDVYHRQTRELIVWRRNFRGQYFPDNIGVAQAEGVVLGFTGSHTPLHLDLGGSLTLQRVLNRTPNSIYRDNWIPFQPAWYGNLQLGIGSRELLRGTVAVRFAGRRYSTESNLDPLTISGGGLSPYGVLDLGLERVFRLDDGSLRLLLRTGIDNLTDTRYELLDRMPMPGRIYHIGIGLERGQK